VLVRQLGGRVVHVKATEGRQMRAEHALLDGRHPERVDGRVVVQVTGHVDRQQTIVRHVLQLARSDLRHLDASLCQFLTFDDLFFNVNPNPVQQPLPGTIRCF